MRRTDPDIQGAALVAGEEELGQLAADLARTMQPGIGRKGLDNALEKFGALHLACRRNRRLAQTLLQDVQTLLRRSDPDLREKMRLQGLRTLARDNIWRFGRVGLIEDLLRRAFGRSTWPLVRRIPSHAEPLVNAEIAIIDQVYQTMHRTLNGTEHRRDEALRHSYPDIAFPMSYAVALMLGAQRILLAQARPDPLRFLDVGCGGGTKVVAAGALFHRALGIEIDTESVELARRLIGASGRQRCSVEHADALAYDDYANFDVIYFYEPLNNLETQMQLERRITAQARPGTVIIAPHPPFDLRCDDYGLSRMADKLYLTGTTPAAAERLRRRAEHIGPDGMSPDPGSTDRRMGWLLPVAMAFRRLGYGFS